MAAITPYMGLKVWNLLTDSFDHVQLAENLAKIDQHTHAEGKGAKIPTGGIEDGAISSAKLGLDAVTDEKILNAPVRGRVSSLGELQSGSGFTSTKTGTGEYTITFNPVLSSNPIVAGATVTSAGYVTVNGATAGELKILVFNPTGTLTNIAFHFIAVPA